MTARPSRVSDRLAAAIGVENELRTRVYDAKNAMRKTGLGVTYRRERRRLLRIALRAVQGARRG